jgi:2-oxoglutarate dehydrogenase E1 component
MHRPYRKPLVIMTPKSLLRHKLAVSNIKDFTKGSCFHRVLLDDAENDSSKIKLQKDSKIKRVVLCSGKIYYDLWDARQEKIITEIYLLRIEQLYPFPSIATLKELKRFKNAEIVWCQEEPKNQGAWTFIEPNIEEALIELKARTKRPIFAGRRPSASPATGFFDQHKTEQSNLIDQALTLEDK